MRLAALLLVICGGLAFLVAHGLNRTPNGAAIQASVTDGAAKGELQPLPKITHGKKKLYDRVADDNLFSPERRPSVDAPPERSTQTAAPSSKGAVGQPSFSLKGIIITPEGRSALVELKRAREYRKVVKGEVIDGWILESIEKDAVTVKKEGTSTIVTLKQPEKSLPRAPRRNLPRRSRRPRSR